MFGIEVDINNLDRRYSFRLVPLVVGEHDQVRFRRLLDNAPLAMVKITNQSVGEASTIHLLDSDDNNGC